MKNYGLILEPIVPNKDWVFGSALSAGGEPLVPSGQWDEYLPPDEFQNMHGIDPQGCVSFGTNNCIEVLLRRVFSKQVNFSDRFLAKVSGTTALGNTPQKVSETIRKIGEVVQEDWPFDESINTWEKFYESVPQNLYTRAVGFLAEYDFFHEYVPPNQKSMMDALQFSPLGASVYAWIEDDGVYFKPESFSDNHWVMIYGYEEGRYWKVFDSYSNSHKRYAWSSIPMQVKRYSITRHVVEESAFQKFLAFLKSLFIGKEPEPVAPTEPVKPEPVKPKVDQIEIWAKAIEDFESGGDKNAVNYQRNNPGNCKNSQGKFIVFATYEAGFAYLYNYLVRACTNDHQAYVQKAAQLKLKSSGDLTIRQFIEVYTFGDSAIIQNNYANHIAKRLGVTQDTAIKTFL